MGFVVSRLRITAAYVSELAAQGLPATTGPMDREVLFLLDGVGGMQFTPLLVRRVLREQASQIGTVMYRWQFGLPGEIWTDLMWHRRNRVMGVGLARRLLSFRRSHPAAKIHLLACSGGAGIAVFALESLRGRLVVDTVILPCPALSSRYNFAPALRAVKRCYVLVSEKDDWILGWGTRLFGTTDRVFAPAGGQTGFRLPERVGEEDVEAYRRFYEIRWTPALKEQGHPGGHSGWLQMPMLRRHLLPLLRGKPRLAAHSLVPDRAA